MKRFGIFFFFLINSLVGQAQLPDNRIIWAEGELLKWEDFKGNPESRSLFDANTNSGISYGWSLSYGGDKKPELSYEVFAFFLPEGSWVKNGEGSAQLLAHEQLHFDITELHARKLKKALAAFEPGDPKSVKKQLQEIYERIELERKLVQKKFDAETNHSQRVEIQVKWQQKVEQELQSLRQFSSTGN